ncbi:MAG: hypothetical protein R3330_04430, partial [Saprospiraceae bacterium]|nr:hypothetical protein [Saprospiraceae bacterium]
ADDFPFLVGYLNDRDTHWLTDPEHEYLLYLGMIILQTMQADGKLASDVDREHLDAREEDLWQQLESLGARPLDKLRKQLPTDNVLSDFVLEALEPDDDELSFMTEPGAQLVYVKLTAFVHSADE